MQLKRLLRMAFLAVIAIAVLLVVFMAAPGAQLGALLPVREAMAQVGACSDCHNPGHFADGEPAPGVGALPGCGDCHSAQQAALLAAPAIPHIQVNCVTCHEGADAGATSHLLTATTTSMGTPPRVNFNLEVCEGCHLDQYNTFEMTIPGRTFYGGSDGGLQPPTGWNKTADFPYLNVLNSGHASVLQGYEDRGMRWAFNDLQQGILPKAEADLLQSGTRAAYYMGITYPKPGRDVEILPKLGRITADRSITAETAVFNSGTGAWDPTTVTLLVPAGTTVTTAIDAKSAPRYQVKTVVTLPDGRIYTSYDDPRLTETARGNDPDPVLAAEARNWIFAALAALDQEGLDFTIPDPLKPYTGAGYHWPSVESGLQCSQCHDPHTNKLRIINKPLIEAIAVRGINPYATTKVYDFNLASRQDQIIAVCAQCHSEQVGGYSANDNVDRSFVPWVKPSDLKDAAGNVILAGLDTQYQTLFGSLQDWTHGGPVLPWQSTDPNARGFAPYGVSYPINAPLNKAQHPEAETFFNSTMYNVGATCTDCHTARITRFDSTLYTTHVFASPLKLMDGFTGITATGQPAVFPPQNPCVMCHTTDTIAQSRQKIKDAQDNFNFVQEGAQVALVNALKRISQLSGAEREANVAIYRRAALRWDYYALAENSMGFHNNLETVNEMGNARSWVDAFIPWPLTPVKLRIASAGPDSLTLTFYDQANDETSFRVERGLALAGPYSLVATVPTPNGAAMGDVSFIETGLTAGTVYFYRVAASNASGTSVFSIWTQGSPHAVNVSAPSGLVATGVTSSQINLTWNDLSSNEIGFRIQRAKDNLFTLEPALFEVAANVTSFANTGLTPNTTYYYRVFAFDGAGNTSLASNTASATPLSAAPPAAPTNLVVRAVGQTYITIGWRDNANNEQGFYVWRCTTNCTSPSATWTRVDGGAVGPNATTFNNTGLVRRRAYWYRVQAYNAGGTSAYSNIVTATTR